jgi:hypothetical protein
MPDPIIAQIVGMLPRLDARGLKTAAALVQSLVRLGDCK